jgi:hypothetical protein
MKKNNKKRGPLGRIKNVILLAALFACVIFLSNEVTNAIATSATVGDRELPIYCVDTDEKKVALSFDAAWGARRLLCLRNFKIYPTNCLKSLDS